MRAWLNVTAVSVRWWSAVLLAGLTLHRAGTGGS